MSDLTLGNQEREQTKERARMDSAIGLLLDWADWQKGYSLKLGYPGRSAGISSGYVSQTFDEMCESADGERNRIVDSCVDELHPAPLKAAILKRYLKLTVEIRDYEHSLSEAHDVLMVAFKKKGVMW